MTAAPGNAVRRKKILVITELYPSPAKPFLGTFVVRQLRQLSLSCDIVVLTTSAHPQAEHHDGKITVVTVAYYPSWLTFLRKLRLINDHHVAAINKGVTSKTILQIAQHLHRQHHFDLVHGHEIYIGDEAIPVGEALGIPSVFTLHGLYEYHLQGFGPKVMSLVLQNLRRVKNVIAVSTIAAQTYLRQGVRPDRLEIIPNGIEWQDDPNPDSHVRQFSANRLTLLTVGFMAKEKRMDQVIRALAALRQKKIDAVLVIVGRGEMNQELRELVTTLKLHEHVLFLGEVPPKNLPTIYTSADIVVHPSVVDSFSMVCLEAMSFGKPVVCTSNIGITEYTTTEKDILVVPPDNQLALHVAIERLATDPQLRHSIGQAAQETAKTFTAEKVAARISALYDQLT